VHGDDPEKREAADGIERDDTIRDRRRLGRWHCSDETVRRGVLFRGTNGTADLKACAYMFDSDT
jgi:hypothetical protein